MYLAELTFGRTISQYAMTWVVAGLAYVWVL